MVIIFKVVVIFIAMDVNDAYSDGKITMLKLTVYYFPCLDLFSF
jgi:hypothetical protein